MILIAEASVNWHNIEEAKEMIYQSKRAHASYCKFQLYSEHEIKDLPEPIRNHLQQIMLNYDTAQELFNYGRQINQKVFFTPMFLEAVDWCEQIGVERYKIRFADRYNIPLIQRILDTGEDKKLIMSIDREYEPPEPVLTHAHRIDSLLCIPEYPATSDSYKLNSATFYFFSGISDHTPGLELARQALKFKSDIIIEKHVKLNNNCIENDWSVSFDELRSLRAFEELKKKDENQ